MIISTRKYYSVQWLLDVLANFHPFIYVTDCVDSMQMPEGLSMKLSYPATYTVKSRYMDNTFEMLEMIKCKSCQMFHFMEAQTVCPKIIVV